MPSVTVKFPAELGGETTIQLSEGEDPQAAIDRRMQSIIAEQGHTGVSESNMSNFAAGMGRGVTNVGRQLGNIVGMDEYGDEALSKLAQQDAPLLDTKAGFTGNLVGEVAATAPIGLGAGGLAAKAGSGLANTIAKKAAIQGATEGAIVGGPDNRVGGAVLGGALGGALTKGAQGLSRTMGARGKGLMGEISEGAEELQQKIGGDAFIPLSQALPEGSTGKMFYEGIAANLPVSGGQIRGQFNDVVEEFVEKAGADALPPASILAPSAQQIRQAGAETTEELMGGLKSAWDESWEVVKGFDVDVPTTFKQPSSSVIKGLKEFDIAWPKPGQTLKTDDLLTLRSQIQQLANQQQGPLGNAVRGRLVAAKKQVDELLTKNLDPSGKGQGAVSKTWRALNSDEGLSAYNKYLDLKKAGSAAGVPRKMTPAHIEVASAKRAGDEGLAGGGALQEYGRQGAEVLQGFPSKQGIFQIGAAAGLMSQIAAIPSLLLTPVIGRKGMQKFLTAQTGGQKAMQEFLEEYGQQIAQAGFLTRGGAVAGAVEGTQ